MTQIKPSEPTPSATVVLLRQQPGRQFEVLMLQKSDAITYGGMWVFPGGVIDTEDRQTALAAAGNDSADLVARYAALRETKEEANIQLDVESLHPFAHWVTPEFRKRRYATWFFVADVNASGDSICIDNGEIVDAQWVSPQDALAAQAIENMHLTGPSFVTLSELAEHTSLNDVLQTYKQRPIIYYEPRIVNLNDGSGVASLYREDAFYDTNQDLTDKDESEDVPIHRLYIYKTGPWRYIRNFG